MRNRECYRFGNFSLDATALVLLRDGKNIPIPKKAVSTLVVLVRSQGQVVTRSELFSAVWPQRVVEDANLAQNIAVLRKALMIGQLEPGAIETFPGRGYRILGPIQRVEEDEVEPLALPLQPLVAASPLSSAADAPTIPVVKPARRLHVGVLVVVGLSVVAVLAVWALLNYQAGTPSEIQKVAVARLGGKQYQPAPSSDGSRVAFVWQQHPSDLPRVWVTEADQSARMLTDGDGEFLSPVWSPDDRQIACMRFDKGQGEIVILPATGGVAQKVAVIFGSRHGLIYNHLAWSPDGKTLAFDDTTANDVPFSIFLYSLQSHSRTRLTEPDASSMGDVNPRFSPDGRKLSFISAIDRSRQELRTIDLHTRSVQTLTADNHQITSQDWATSGDGVFFVSNRSSEFRIWKTSSSARTPIHTSISADSAFQIAMASKTPTLVYAVLRQNFNIWKLDLNPRAGTEEDEVRTRWSPLITSSSQDASPVVSPAGDRICFRSDRSGEEQLWVSGVDGAKAVQVTRGTLRPSVGHWSHDGKSIVFHSANTGELYIAADNGVGWFSRALGHRGLHPVFSADDRFVYAGETASIEQFPVQGGEPKVLAPFAGVSLLVSPDGRFLYHLRSVSATSLWRLDLQTHEEQKVLDGVVPYCTSCWALAEDGVYYLGRLHQSADEQAIFFHGWNQPTDHEIARYPEPINPIGSGPFSLLPDGRHLVCVRAQWPNVDVTRVQPFR